MTKTKAAIFTDMVRERLNPPPEPVPEEIVEKREQLRRAQAEYFAAETEFREALAKVGRSR